MAGLITVAEPGSSPQRRAGWRARRHGSAGLVLATGDLGIDPAGTWVDVVPTS